MYWLTYLYYADRGSCFGKPQTKMMPSIGYPDIIVVGQFHQNPIGVVVLFLRYPQTQPSSWVGCGYPQEWPGGLKCAIGKIKVKNHGFFAW